MKRGFLLRAQERDKRKAASTAKAKATETVSNAAGSAQSQGSITSGLPVLPLSYGNVSASERALPDDYKKYLSHPLFTKKNKYTLEYMTVPQPNDEDGCTELIYRGEDVKKRVLSFPKFPSRPPKPRQPGMAIVKETTNMGLGLFATCDIKTGELVFVERPLLVTPRGFPTLLLPHYTDEQRHQISLIGFEKALQVAIDRMPEEKRKAFMALANNHTEDGSGPILGIIRTNSYGVVEIVGEDSAEADWYGAIGEIGSRINHSCRPNIKQEFDMASFSLQFIAQTNVREGDQLVYSYCEAAATVADRQAELAPYGIVCDCHSCVNATPATDKLRVTHAQEHHSLYKRCLATWDKGRITEQKDLDAMLKLEKDMMEEGIHGTEVFYALLMGIATTYKLLGKVPLGRAYWSRCPEEMHGKPNPCPF